MGRKRAPPAACVTETVRDDVSDASFDSAESDERSNPPTAPGTPRKASTEDSFPSPSATPKAVKKPEPAAVSAPKAAPAAASAHRQPKKSAQHFDASPGAIATIVTAIGYMVMMGWSYVREAFRYIFPDPDLQVRTGYAPLTSGMGDFFSRRIYRRIRDCWNRPINTRAGRIIGVMERKSDAGNKKFELTGKTIPCINLASYNYLGFSEDIPSVTEDNLDALERYGTGACASSQEGGQSELLRELETETAAFVGKEAAAVYAMGFITNFSGLAPLFCKDTLVISDSLNHASLVLGLRVATSAVKVFKHNNTQSLEKIVRAAVIDGKPRTGRSWKRIVIVVEGIYSMEGEILDLPRVVEIKKKYKCLLYVDEAHSIGALGKTGRGICEHHGVDPADVDILMGTYTKSFGSIGGYIAGPRKLIADLKRYSGASLTGDTLHSAAAQQALSSLRVMLGKDGTTIGQDKIRQLKENSQYMRAELAKRDLVVLGEEASPVIPVMIYQPGKLAMFSRELLKRNVAVVVVGYPATSPLEMRARLCISAAQTRADLDHALKAIDEVSELVGVRYALPWPFSRRL